MHEKKDVQDGSQNVGNLYSTMNFQAYSRYMNRVNQENRQGMMPAFDLKQQQAEKERQLQEAKLLAEQKKKEEQDARRLEELEDRYLCPITREFMQDPVKIKGFEHHAFERSAIEDWFKKHDTNPMNGEVVKDKTLIPDPNLKSEIEDYVKPKQNKTKPF